MDYRNVNKFKVADGKNTSVDRLQLPEGNDVISHKQAVVRDYEAKNDDYLIKAKNINKVYVDFAAVKDNSFQVKKGEVLGLLGPNGAGKSTTFNMVTMDLKRSSGDIKLFN